VWTAAALSLFVPLTEIYGKIGLQSATRPEEFQRLTQALKSVGRETTQVHYRIGEFYARAGKHDKAITHFRRSIELFPTGRVWLALGNEYRVLGQWGRARAAFESAIELNPDVATAHAGRAQALLKLSSGSREEAMASLERALVISPGYSRAAVLLALQYDAMGRTDQAIRTLERSLEAEKQSDSASVLRELARLRP
jgi:tetratricopeptide (TPR) repeat protein